MNWFCCTFVFAMLISGRLSQGFSNKAINIKQKVFLSSIEENSQKRRIDGKIPIVSRKIPIGSEGIDEVTVWELDNPSKLMEMWWSADLDPASAPIKKEKIGDPFGVIMWPGSILASKELARHQKEVFNSTVLVLGPGTGVEVQAAAKLGASCVHALDISKLTLKLLKFGAEQAGVDNVVRPIQFDLFSKEDLPDCDIIVVADLLYNEELAMEVGRRCVEVLSRKLPPKIIVTDSQRFRGTDFLKDVNSRLEGRYRHAPLEWEYYELVNIKGSGVMIDCDQVYDATTRMFSAGWNE